MGDTAALDVHLHPLVLINISDHVVRFSTVGNTARVLGALIGAQESRRIDVHNSFELSVTEEAIDLEFFQMRLAQYMEVFPRYEVLGWYSTGREPQESDKAWHKKIQEVTGNDNPFCVLLDACRLRDGNAAESEDLPVKVFDSQTRMNQDGTQIEWNEVPYVIDTLEAERIAVNHVAKSATTTAAHSSDFTQHAGSLKNSVSMLSKRVAELVAHVQEVKAGRAPKDRETMRQLLSICRALEASHPGALRNEFYGEYDDAALVVLLASLTKTCANTADLLDKFQLAHDKKHRQRHHYPFG